MEGLLTLVSLFMKEEAFLLFFSLPFVLKFLPPSSFPSSCSFRPHLDIVGTSQTSISVFNSEIGECFSEVKRLAVPSTHVLSAFPPDAGGE